MRPFGVFTSCTVALASVVSCTAASLNQTATLELGTRKAHNVSSNSTIRGEPVAFWPCNGFDAENAGFAVEEITLSPNPPVRGKDLDIVITGDLRETMDAGAYVKVTVWKLGTRLTKLQFDWCANIQGLTCPVLPGNVTFSKTQNIDRRIPPWTFTLTVEAFNSAGDQITCMNLKAKVAKHAS